MNPAAIAANRFGIGMRGDAPPAPDPQASLLRELGAFEPHPPALSGLPTRAEVAGALSQLRATRAARAPTPAPAERKGRNPARKLERQEVHSIYLACAGARINAALVTPAPFIERMVHFWANHFAVSVDKAPVQGFAGLFEFEAIRPHVLGRFADLLGAALHHPAMLLYLDQAQSIGPESVAGRRRSARNARQSGLNENLAREILELHTLGVRSGYSQDDVTEFARALTGWTVAGLAAGQRHARGEPDIAPGEVYFREQQHQPGSRRILGKRYESSGAAQSQAVLGDLARHPATAQHIAAKLARHIIGDVPPPALITRLAAVFLASDGDLTQLYRALIEAPECWGPAPGKFKSPWDWSLSALRSINQDEVEAAPAAGMLLELGQPVWKPGSPAGYDDMNAGWAAPDALLRRVEAAQRLAQRAGHDFDARTLAGRVLPGGVGTATMRALSQAESGAQSLALLWASPEFMRR